MPRAIEIGTPTPSECATRDSKLTKFGGLGGISSHQVLAVNAALQDHQLW